MGRRVWIVIAVVVVAVVVVAAGSLLGWWEWKTLIGWRRLVGYIEPTDATGRKDAVQVYAVIVAGLVATITAAVGLANLYYTRKNLEKQRELEAQRAQGSALQAYYEQIGKLLTEHDLRNTERKDIKHLARGQTLTMLKAVDASGKVSLLTFLRGAGLIEVENPAVELNGAELGGAHLGDVDLAGANLVGANLQGADLVGANLQGANLFTANLQEANLQEANLVGANLQGADLVGANLQGANLVGANLGVANLQGANLQGANLFTANLVGAILQGADLGVAILQGANLGVANLQGAILQGAIFYKTNLKYANLQGADLRGAKSLVQGQIDQALGDETTKLPEGVNHPKSWGDT